MDRDELVNLRKQLGYSLRDFGKKVGIPFQRLSEYEKGKKNISLMTESRIKSAIGLVEDWKPDYELHIHLDYLRLTFFGSTYQKVMNQILGICEEYFFYEPIKRHNYDGIYSCGMIQIYVSEKIEQGVMLEMTGQGLREFESFLEEFDCGYTLNEWLIQITNPEYYETNQLFTRFNCSRLDLAIDEMLRETGNYDLHDLKRRQEEGDGKLVESSLQYGLFEESYWKDKPSGLTLYYGSPNGNFRLRMYEKSKERARKENIELEEALDTYRIVNRYEMQIRKNYAEEAFFELSYTGTISQFAINLLLSKISVYEEIELEPGKVERIFYQPFYNVFGDFQKIKVNGKNNETSIEKSMKWIETQVSGSLRMLQEVFGDRWLFDWLDKVMSDVKLSERQEKIVRYELARVATDENLAFLWWEQRVNVHNFGRFDRKVDPFTVEKGRAEKLYCILLKNFPSHEQYFISPEGEYVRERPEGMTLEEINDLGNEQGIDFIKNPLFDVFDLSLF